jgi:hypothetical protein
MHFPDSVTRLRFLRHAEAVWSRGPTATTEALLEISRRIGGLPAIIAVLREIEARPHPRPPQLRRRATR